MKNHKTNQYYKFIMNSKKLFVPLFLLVMFFSFGQERDITVNFLTKEVGEIPNDIKPGDYYRMVINNINLNLWKISLNTGDSVTITKLQTPTFGNVKIDELSSIVSNLMSVTSSSKANTENIAKGIGEIINFYKEKLEDNDELIAERILKEKVLLSGYLSKLNKISTGLDTLKYNIAKLQLYYLDNEDIIKNEGFDLNKTIKEIEKYRTEIIELKESIEGDKSRYVDIFYKRYVDDINKKQEFKDSHKLILDSYNKFESTLSKIFESINSENAIMLLKSIVFLKPKCQTYTSLPIQFNGDKAIVKLRIEPKKEDFNLQTFEMPLIFPVNDYNYWSVGISFYGSNLYNEKYSSISEPVTDSTKVYKLFKEDNQKSEIGIATLLRFGKKIKVYKNDEGKKLGIHGTIGPGVSIEEKIKPRLLLGVGFSHGYKHNIALDFGFILGYVQRKSNAFDLDVEYLEKPENVTVSKLSSGGFISLGYLFTF
ncbi:hypothetical protein [Tenacibaculum sp.]|uniref:hypothetical protein n=1 Tax=Tenacibaculum sp. TaxID=1906242 RepID=UPI003D152062